MLNRMAIPQQADAFHVEPGAQKGSDSNREKKKPKQRVSDYAIYEPTK